MDRRRLCRAELLPDSPVPKHPARILARCPKGHRLRFYKTKKLYSVLRIWIPVHLGRTPIECATCQIGPISGGKSSRHDKANGQTFYSNYSKIRVRVKVGAPRSRT